jgi:hypothetical protein
MLKVNPRPFFSYIGASLLIGVYGVSGMTGNVFEFHPVTIAVWCILVLGLGRGWRYFRYTLLAWQIIGIAQLVLVSAAHHDGVGFVLLSGLVALQVALLWSPSLWRQPAT